MKNRATGLTRHDAPTAQRPAPAVIVVAGGRVGVGASTLAAGLAVNLAASQSTLLVDADEGGATLHALLGARDATTLDDLLRRLPTERVLTRVSGRLSLVAGRPAALPPLSAPQRQTLFERLAELYPQFDVVVIDAGSRAATMLAACRAPEARALIVTTGDRIAAAGAHAVEKLLHLEFPEVPATVVGNMLDEAGAVALQELLASAAQQFLGRDLLYLGTVPADPTLAPLLAGRAPDASRPDVLPLSLALLALTEIGDRVLTSSDPAPVAGTAPLLHRSNHGTR